jgi:trimeric autotransporter adhesin
VPGIDGTVTGNILARLVTTPVSVEIGGMQAEVLFAGAAPELVNGVMQINVRIPEGAPSGNVPVVVTVGSVSSQAGVTVAVR